MKWEKVRKAMLVSVCALQICLLGSIANAEEQSAASAVTIKSFALLEKKFDKTGSAEFKPDGSRDGHFQASIHFAQKTVVNAIILRSTDVFGKENYHGIWRTNRVGVGWLLGIVQGQKVITPAFRPSPKDPVGTFEGTVTFDLFANDNGDIEEGQYFVLEIETPDDTIYSEPITFGEPMNGGEAEPTPNPAPNPTNPTPNPIPSPTPSQTTDLAVTGGHGTIQVQGATPGAVVTLFQTIVGSRSNRIYNHGSKVADSKGNVAFAKQARGDKYYVTESVNGKKSRTSGEATVTNEKTAELFVNDDVSAYIIMPRAQAPANTKLDLTVRGTVADKEIKSVAVSYAGVSVNVPVDEKGNFNLLKSYDVFSPLDVVTVTASASNGKKHVIHKKLGFDLFDDSTVKAEALGNEWVISANKGTVFVSNFQVYAIEDNTLIPLKTDEGSVTKEFDTAMKYQGKLATTKNLRDIRLVVQGDSFVEIVPIMQ
ncbi:MAG TPA: hypothetical protein VE710_22390 [Candidatus Bathyarchaeia archaeon]|nr:hypothetical protein [Candidatus Bathyarchaeia archaeon]